MTGLLGETVVIGGKKTELLQPAVKKTPGGRLGGSTVPLGHTCLLSFFGAVKRVERHFPTEARKAKLLPFLPPAGYLSYK